MLFDCIIRRLCLVPSRWLVLFVPTGVCHRLEVVGVEEVRLKIIAKDREIASLRAEVRRS